MAVFVEWWRRQWWNYDGSDNDNSCGSACHGLGTEVGGWLLSVEQLKKEKKRVTINQCDKIDGKGMIVIFLNN